LEQQVPVQEVSYAELRGKLLQDKQVLEIKAE